MSRDVVVIGGGIIGCSIALELRTLGADVTLIERSPHPQGASAFSFASVSAFDEPLKEVYLLKARGISLWRDWTKRFGPEIGITWNGEVRWAESAPAARVLRDRLARATRRGYQASGIGESKLKDLLPGASPREVMAATWAPGDGQVDPVQAIATLRTRFTDLGGVAIEAEATLSSSSGGVTLVVDGRSTTPGTVVVASGAGTQGLLGSLGDIPMDPSPGFLTVTEPVGAKVTDRTVYVWPEGSPPFHLRQLADSSVVLGEWSQDHVVEEPTTRHALRLLHQARRSFPALDACTVDRFTVEWRPMPADGMPIVGPLPGTPSVYVAAAHSGITIAPAIGALVASEVVTRAPDPHLDPFRPGRFAALRAEADRKIEEVFQSH